jgi:septal ring factor EnvC (AmiA/AmiB activator)
MKFLKNILFSPNKILLILFIISFLFNPALAQDKKNELKQEKNKIEKEIQYTNNLLSETKKSKKTSLNQLIILNNKISYREKLIAAINSEINILNNKIDANNSNIKELTNELLSLKNEYAKMIYFVFKNRSSYDRLMFIFSSEDFNQAYKRLKYFQQYSAYRKTQVELIKKTQDEINVKTKELENQKAKKVTLLKTREKEKGLLIKEKNEKNNTIKKLANKEKELLKTLRAKEKESNKLKKAIKAIIDEEIRLAAEKAKETKTKTTSKIISLTPEESRLSNTFSENKGNLPWPSEKGIISGTFGEHRHPVLKRVKTKNNGINILTNKGAYARAIYNGTVISVKSITNTNTAVIIRHGEYFSVYSNLDNVFVKRG